MKAAIYTKKSHNNRFTITEIPTPTPTATEILVKIKYVSLNAADYRSMKLGIIPKNKIFGSDVSGIVEAVGSNVTEFKPGDQVIGELANHGFGGFAEYVSGPEKAFVHKPQNVSFDQGAALPISAVTALQALRDKGQITKGDNVLIVGSSGGVGTFAIQLAKYYGAKVTAVCSIRNIEQSKQLGADKVINYQKEDFLKQKDFYNVILAVNGNRSLYAYKRALCKNGRYVMVGGSFTQIFAALLFGWIYSFGSKKMHSLPAKGNAKDLNFVTSLTSQGIIKPVIEKTYSLNQINEAMKYCSAGHSKAKILVEIL